MGYHMDLFNKRVLPYVASHANLAVFNLGIHYHDDAVYEEDLWALLNQFRACSKKRVKCLYRETFPQHFVYDEDDDVDRDGSYKPIRGKTKKCGPINKLPSSYNVISTAL